MKKLTFTDYPLTTTPIDSTNLNLVQTNIAEAIDSGWVDAEETWTYASVDDPTGNVTISGDKTTKYSLGMRIKFTNGGNVIYGIITKIAYSSPNTTLTFLHQIDPTDSLALYLMTNSAITLNYYSSMKAPYGFPTSQLSWSLQANYTSNTPRESPTQNVWYNIGSFSLTIPIGEWKTQIKGKATNIASSAATYIAITLSTANNSSTDEDFTFGSYAGLTEYQLPFYNEKILNLTAKTPYYMNERTTIASTTRLRLDGGEMKAIIRAICTYL